MYNKLFIMIIGLTLDLAMGQSTANSSCTYALITDANGSEDVVIDCNYNLNNECVELEVDYTQLYSTDSYVYESIDYNPMIPFTQGTPLTSSMASASGIVPDLFSDLIPIGFDFCFYDQTFNSLVIGDNGIISFDPNYAQTSTPSAIPAQNPSPSLVSNAIFAIQQDLWFDTATESEIYYSTIGEAPCRKFIINYYKGDIYGCTESITTQIVLHEITNEIDVHILDKPISCDNGRDNSALLGIINKDGSQGISPVNRNTGEWSASSESWKFKPTGNREPSIKWKDSKGKVVGNGKNIKVCPDEDTIYTAEVKYQNCQGSSLILSDEISVKYDAAYPIIEKNEFYICDQYSDGEETVILSNFNGQILQDAGNFNLTYYLDENAAINETNSISKIKLTNNQIVYVRIRSNIDTNCFIIAPITLNFASANISNLLILICDDNNDEIEENVNLGPYINNLLAGVKYEDYTIYNSQQDAEDMQNNITKSDLSPSTQLWLSIKYFEGCEKVIGPINVQFLIAPPHRTTQTITRNLCDTNFDGIEAFAWDPVIRSVMNINVGETLSVHKTAYQAKNNRNPQSEIEDRDSYYVRIQNPNGCFTVIEQPVDITFKGINANNYTKYICFDGNEDIAIDLDDYISEMNVSIQGYNNPLTDLAIAYYKNEEHAFNNTNAIGSNQLISDDGYRVEKTYYVRFQLPSPSGCYSVRTIIVNLIHPEPLQNPVLVCDIFNDQTEYNTLSSYNDEILGDQKGTVKYFKTLEDAQNRENELETLDFPETITLYVLISSHGCEKIYPLKFEMTSVAEVQDVEVTLGTLCDNNNDNSRDINLASFNNKVYAGSDATFKYYLSYDETTKVLSDQINTIYNYVSNDSFTFYVDVNVAGESCNGIAKVTVNFDKDKTLAIDNKERYACDLEGDLNETFDLKQVYDEYVESLQNFDSAYYNVSFHRSESKAIAGKNPISIGGFIPNTAAYTIYVRAYDKLTGCMDIKTLILYSYTPPKPVDGELDICDTNFDGNYDMMLSELNEVVMYATEGYNFSYYHSEQEAINKQNPIDNSTVLELDSYYPTIWVRVERASLDTCYDVKPVKLNYKSSVLIPIQDYFVNACDNNLDGLATMDLTTIENEFPPNQYTYSYYESLQDIKDRKTPIENPSSYTNATAYQETIYLMVHQEGSCSNYVEVDLIYHQIKASLKDVKFCPGESTSIIPDVADDNDSNNPKYTYEWYDESGALISKERILTDVTEEQTFTLKVMSNAYPVCYKELKVEASHYDVPVIIDILEANNNVTVIANGNSRIEYSLDGTNWQDSNIFYNVAHGVYSFWVRYVDSECKGAQKEFVVLFLPSVITPNGDGINDKFIVKNLEVFGDELSSLVIFDRYGKVIHQTQGKHEMIWDGTSLGRNVVTSDYWYILALPDGREKTGHISVKNQFNQE